MNKVIWITIEEARVILECTRSNVYLLMHNGSIRRRESAKERGQFQCRHSDCVDYRMSSAWRQTTRRSVGPSKKGMRAKKDQPIIPDDILLLIKSWNGSEDQKVFHRRYSCRRKNNDG